MQEAIELSLRGPAREVSVTGRLHLEFEGDRLLADGFDVGDLDADRRSALTLPLSADAIEQLGRTALRPRWEGRRVVVRGSLRSYPNWLAKLRLLECITSICDEDGCLGTTPATGPSGQ